MRKGITFVLMTGFSFLALLSCDGGGGKGDGEYTVYDVFMNIEIVGGFDSDCPDSANLKLTLLINGNRISGTTQIFGFGNLSEPVEIGGIKEDNVITLQDFKVAVPGESAQFGDSLATDSLQFSFSEFQGVYTDGVDTEPIGRIEGNVSGKVLKNLLDAIFCNADFTGEFTAEERIPQGCVSRLEIPTLECPAEGFINQCDQYNSYFCTGWCEYIDDYFICADFLFNASKCEIIDCMTLTCPQVGTINLEQDGGFMFGSGDHILHCV